MGHPLVRGRRGIRPLSYGGAPSAVGISVGDAKDARCTTRSGDYSENVDAVGGSTSAVDRERIRNSAVENVERVILLSASRTNPWLPLAPV
jgi:hypothetical protein